MKPIRWKKQTDFGGCVRMLLRERGWTVGDLCILVGCSPGYLYRVIRGEQEPSWSLACAIADATEHPVSALRINRQVTLCPHCNQPFQL